MSANNDERIIEALVRVEAMGDDISEIKQVMSQVAAAITKLALVEERQARAGEDLGRAFRLLDNHGTRIESIENKLPSIQKSSSVVDRVVTMIVAAVVTAVLGLVLVNQTQKVAPSVVIPGK